MSEEIKVTVEEGASAEAPVEGEVKVEAEAAPEVEAPTEAASDVEAEATPEAPEAEAVQKTVPTPEPEPVPTPEQVNAANAERSTGKVDDDGQGAAFFTAADVRAMSREQVRRNLPKILRSMESDKF